jgi:hypothetical protein
MNLSWTKSTPDNVLVLDTVKMSASAVKLTLVKVVLVLLALGATASGRVELVADATEEAARLALLGRGLLGATLLSSLLVAVTAGEFLDKVHG